MLVRVGSSRHSRRSLWRGCGCIRSSLAAVPTCSASRSVRRPPVSGLHRPCGHEALLTTLTTRRFSLLANDGFCTRFAVPAEPPLLSPTRARRGPPACATLSPAVRGAFSPSSASATVAGRNSPKRRAVCPSEGRVALQTVPMRCCDDLLILKGVDRHEKMGKASLNPLCGG